MIEVALIRVNPKTYVGTTEKKHSLCAGCDLSRSSVVGSPIATL